MARHPDRAVLIVEGEKCNLAARYIVGEIYVVISWSQGCKAWKQADWTLRLRHGGRKMKVREFFEMEKISPANLNDIRDESDYWEKAGAFVLDNWEREIQSLSPRQVKWLDQIQEDMVERRIEGRL